MHSAYKYLLGIILTLTSFQAISQDSSYVIVQDLPDFDFFNKWYIQLNDSVKDIEGNYYHLVKLGDQIWMEDNLQTSKYNDGTPIPLVQDSSAWINNEHDAYSTHTYFNKTFYYYNYQVVINEAGVCPTGFKIPDSTDWRILEEYAHEVNSDFIVGNGILLPNSDTMHIRKNPIDCWTSDIEGLSFSNQPYGYISGKDGQFNAVGSYGYWWSKSAGRVPQAWSSIFEDRCLGIDDIHLAKHFILEKDEDGTVENYGFQIRCIKE